MSWEQTLTEKAAELELIASWASQTNFGRVRDLCRQAKHELLEEVDRRTALAFERPPDALPRRLAT